MPPLLNVLIAMQAIQRDIVAVQQRLVKLVVLLPEDAELLEACIDTLESTWRYANDYEQALPSFATPFRNQAKD